MRRRSMYRVQWRRYRYSDSIVTVIQLLQYHPVDAVKTHRLVYGLHFFDIISEFQQLLYS